MSLLIAAVIVLMIVVVALSAALYVRSRTISEMKDAYGLSYPSPLEKRASLRAGSESDVLAKKSYNERQTEIEGLVTCAAALGDFPDELKVPCVDALSGGKHIRGIFVLEISQTLNSRRAQYDFPLVDCGELALAVEYAHAASLVVDDMPYFDDDAERRERPSIQAKYGPAKAQLAALCLIFAAQDEITRQVETVRACAPDLPNPDRAGMLLAAETSRVVRTTANAQIAEQGATHWNADYGTQRDAHPDPENASDSRDTPETHRDAVHSISRGKTAGLFELAFVAPYVFVTGDFNKKRLDTIRKAGEHFGMAFQIADDLRDRVSDREKGNPNFVEAYGEETALRELDQNLNSAELILKEFGLYTPTIDEIFEVVRSKILR